MHILNHCNHGHGNAHVAIDLALSQVNAGHTVDYVSEGGDYEALLGSSGVNLIRIKQKSRSPLRVIISIIKLCYYVRLLRPDVIHGHMMSGVVIAYVASRLLRVPLVTTVHNSFDRHSTLMRLGDRVVAVSEAEKRSLERRGFISNRLRVVLNGPNESPRLSLLKNHSIVGKTRRPAVVTICGLHARKGVTDLLVGFESACRVHKNLTLYIVGDGPDREKLVMLASNLKITDRVVFTGNINDPREVLNQADIFVLASYADPCSLAIAEARYAGCAVIATAVGGSPELLGQGSNGILIEPGHPEEIASALLCMISSRNELARWKEKALSGSDYLTMRRVCADYMDIYHDAIAAIGGRLGVADNLNIR
uniref:glycosyltransferase family 4 protein n=1 Tax=Methylobacterium sp. B34 TaxID=95563 RepID=UPI0016512821|nr:glycosyltransferase family 4 protein [Methylobacterium sp. B34]